MMVQPLSVEECDHLISLLGRLRETLGADTPPYVRRLVWAMEADPRFDAVKINVDQQYVSWYGPLGMYRCRYQHVPLTDDSLFAMIERSAKERPTA